jgi:serine O-acetyltransferase
MKYAEYKYLILSDLYRITGNIRFSVLLRNILFHETYRYVFWWRTCRYVRASRLLKYPVYPFAKLMLHHLTYRLGITIRLSAEIGSGFYLGHFGGVHIGQKAVIGKNCDIAHEVTLGVAGLGKKRGYPTLGDNIYVGAGAKIIGAVRIGNNVAIGANCVVTKDIPDNSVVVGVPGKVISQKGSTEYVINTDYDDKIR